MMISLAGEFWCGLLFRLKLNEIAFWSKNTPKGEFSPKVWPSQLLRNKKLCNFNDQWSLHDAKFHQDSKNIINDWEVNRLVPCIILLLSGTENWGEIGVNSVSRLHMSFCNVEWYLTWHSLHILTVIVQINRCESRVNFCPCVRNWKSLMFRKWTDWVTLVGMHQVTSWSCSYCSVFTPFTLWAVSSKSV